VALVLGGGGGLGGAIARTLASEGARVVVADLVESAAANTVTDIREAGGEARTSSWDLADLSAMESAVTELEVDGWSVDILVNISVGPPPSPVTDQVESLWEDRFKSIVLPVIELADRVLPGMR